MSFLLSDDLDYRKVFLSKWSDVSGKRVDPDYVHYLKETQLYKFETFPLKKLLSKKSQYGANEVGIIRKNETETRYIRITDIDKNGSLKNYLGATSAVIDKQYFLNHNDIIIARSGNTVGKAYLHKDKGYPCIFAGYMIRFIVDSNKIMPEYLFAFTQLDVYKTWVSAIQRSSGQPNINAEEYGSLDVPVPPRNIQLKITEKFKLAYELKKQKELEVKKLLDSVDNYILKELGIKQPKIEETSVGGLIFMRQFSEVSGKRIDPSSQQVSIKNCVNAIKNGYYEVTTLQQAATFQNYIVKEVEMKFI